MNGKWTPRGVVVCGRTIAINYTSKDSKGENRDFGKDSRKDKSKKVGFVEEMKIMEHALVIANLV
jgi:hypothetical protein